MNYLQIPIDGGRDAFIPIGMTQDSYDILLASLNLWRSRLVKQESESEEESPKPTTDI